MTIHIFVGKHLSPVNEITEQNLNINFARIKKKHVSRGLYGQTPNKVNYNKEIILREC